MRAGQPLTHLVSFASGLPDANVSWSLLTLGGALLVSDIVTPAEDAISVIITVPGEWNALADGELQATRDLVWTYEVDGLTESGEHRYSIEGSIPFDVARDGVRAKLGVSDADVPDADINLIKAYLQFQKDVSAELLAPFVGGSAYDQIVISDAIEALAAIALIPTMPVRVAKSESSGTNEFARDKVDWLAMRLDLERLAGLGRTLVNPSLDPSVTLGDLFVLTAPSDPFTGA